MVPTGPVTPEPACSGPATAGQKVRQEPAHLDVVGVSGANQYRTLPLASVSTCWPPTVVCDTVLPPAAAGEAGVLFALPELAQADTVSARAASPAAPHIARISGVSPSRCSDLPLEITCRRGFQFSFPVGSWSWMGRHREELGGDNVRRLPLLDVLEDLLHLID